MPAVWEAENMSFDPKLFSDEVAALLALYGNGNRLMPLAEGRCSNPEAHEVIGRASAETLFPGARDPKAALAGLYLYFSCLDEAHSVAQDVPSREGSFWHGILHRQEPDAANAAYWFRQVGKHPVFPELRQRAAASGVDFGSSWDPFAFIRYCETSRTQPGSQAERQAMEVQLVEWQLLFHYCAARQG
jgi:hypothetical protein